MTVANRPRSARKCRHTGLSQSCWRWLSQHVEMRSGGPEPCTAYAIRTPSADRQNRTSCGGEAETRPNAGTIGWYRPSLRRSSDLLSEPHRARRCDRCPHRERQLRGGARALFDEEPGAVLRNKVAASQVCSTERLHGQPEVGLGGGLLHGGVAGVVDMDAPSAVVPRSAAVVNLDDDVAVLRPRPVLEGLRQVDQPNPETVVRPDVRDRPGTAGPEEQRVLDADLAHADAAHEIEVEEAAHEHELSGGVADQDPHVELTGGPP